MKFTLDAYEHMLKELSKDYEFISFSKAKFSRTKLEKKVLLRHDVDQSVEKTQRIAEIEASLGISSTYFLLFRSPFYNIFSYDEEKQIRNLVKMNHFIGLHFDYTGYSFSTVSQLSHQAMLEADIIQRYFNVKVDAVSFHRPFSIEHLKQVDFGVLPHAYEAVFLEDYHYLSDSIGRWRYGAPLDSDAYKQRKNMQILVHGEWWNEEELDRLQTVENYRKDYMVKFERFLQSEMKGFWDSLKVEKETV